MTGPTPTKKYEYSVSLGDVSVAGRLTSSIGRGKRVLEIGCASGSQTRVLAQDLGCSVVGIEIDPVAAERARPFCERIIVGDVESLPLERLLDPGAFDAVLMGDVLEHLRSPEEILRRSRAFLKPSGFLIASIPNFTHASITYEIAHGKFEYNEKGLLDDTHIRFFSRQSVLKLFDSAGYIVERLERNVIEPKHTEFGTTARDNADSEFLSYILEKNAEAKTYQFLVQAVPKDFSDRVQIAAASMREQIERLEQELHRVRRDLNRAESHLSWLKTRSLTGILGRLRRFLRGPNP